MFLINRFGKYSNYAWILFLAFPFMMQGFKSEEILSKNEPIFLPIEAELDFHNQAIKLEVARTKNTLSKGLTYREQIQNDRGMLYQSNFNNDSYFTGKGNKMATELIFLHGSLITDIQGIYPCDQDKCFQYTSREKYEEVIEVKAGVVNKLGLKIGSTVEIRYLPKS